MAALVAQRQTVPPTRRVLEAPGGCQRAVVAARAPAGLLVVVATPRRTRAVAPATGPWATTEALAARAHFAAAVWPPPRPLPAP
jgi:hypothetical protein